MAKSINSDQSASVWSMFVLFELGPLCLHLSSISRSVCHPEGKYSVNSVNSDQSAPEQPAPRVQTNLCLCCLMVPLSLSE